MYQDDIEKEEERSKAVLLHSDNGLYYCTVEDMTCFSSKVQSTEPTSTEPNKTGRHVSFFQTHIKADTDRATQVRELQQQMMWPSDDAMKCYLKQNLIKGTNLKPKDVNNANLILGKPLASVRGKTMAPHMIKNKSQQIMLRDIPELEEQMVKLYVVLFYINRIPFLHTKSKGINYIIIQKLDKRTTCEISKRLKNVIPRYITRGITITDVFVDNEFNNEAYKQLVLPATLHICAKGEHVPIIERSIRTVKERVRSVFQGTPFDRLPKLMTISLMEGVERWLNTFPSTNNHELNPSPAMVVEGRDYPDGTMKRIAFGTCAMVYVGSKNNLSTRTEPFVALCDSNNSGGHYFMSLKTRRRIHANKWTEVPTSQDVIDRVHYLALGAKQQRSGMDSFTF